jgi:hypothetical protein
MASALLSLQNAVVVFDVPTVGTIVDQRTGNILPRTERVTISLYLRQGSLTEADVPGVGNAADVFDGYAISPQALDPRIVPGVRGLLSFSADGPMLCELVKGREPYGTTGLIGSTLQQVIGDRVRIVRYRQTTQTQ